MNGECMPSNSTIIEDIPCAGRLTSIHGQTFSCKNSTSDHNKCSLDHLCRSEDASWNDFVSAQSARRHEDTICYFAAQDVASGLAAFGLTVASSTTHCVSPRTAVEKSACGADIFVLLSEMTGVMGAIATLAGTCPSVLNDVNNAGCIADSMDVIDVTFMIGTFGTVVAQDCK